MEKTLLLLLFDFIILITVGWSSGSSSRHYWTGASAVQECYSSSTQKRGLTLYMNRDHGCLHRKINQFPVLSIWANPYGQLSVSSWHPTSWHWAYCSTRMYLPKIMYVKSAYARQNNFPRWTWVHHLMYMQTLLSCLSKCCGVWTIGHCVKSRRWLT